MKFNSSNICDICGKQKVDHSECAKKRKERKAKPKAIGKKEMNYFASLHKL